MCHRQGLWTRIGLTSPSECFNSFLFGFLFGIALTWVVWQAAADIVDPTDDTRLDRWMRNSIRVMKQGAQPEVRGEK